MSMTSQTQLARRQHKVPQWHLRRFADASGHLWSYRRNLPPKRLRPRSICWELDFYEFELNGCATRNEYEVWFGLIENDAAAMCNDLLQRCQLMQEDAVVWATYAASLFLRSSKCREQMRSSMIPKFREESRSADFVRSLQYAILKRGTLVPAADLRKLIEARRMNMETSQAYYHLAAIKETTSALAGSLLRKTWHTLEAAPGHAFLLGDCPVSTIEFVGTGRAIHGSGFNNQNTAVILPLSPRYLFVASPPHLKWRSAMGPQQVAEVNLLTVRFAHEVVLSNLNAASTQTLVDAEINQFVFGRDGFIPPGRN